MGLSENMDNFKASNVYFQWGNQRFQDTAISRSPQMGKLGEALKRLKPFLFGGYFWQDHLIFISFGQILWI